MRLPDVPCSFALAAALALTGCQEPMAAAVDYPQTNPPVSMGAPAPNPPAAVPPQGYAPPPPQGYAPPQPQPPFPPLPPQAYAPPAPLPPPAAPAASDPVNTVDLPYLRATGKAVLAELIAALPPERQARVQGIPYVTDANGGEINAYAGCDDQRQPFMAITDGLLQMDAYIAQLQATDEVLRHPQARRLPRLRRP